jgi:23S rRNA (guanosine2251-2'-O)-methyltransferase
LKGETRVELKNIIFGRRAVLEALRSNTPIDEILIQKQHHGPAMMEIEREAEARSIVLRDATTKTFHDLLPNHNHQGVIAKIAQSEFHYASLEDIVDDAAEKNEKLLVAILDEITDTHNLGAIIRSAECAGFHGIIIPKHRSAEINATVIKTSAGAALHMRIAQVTNVTQTIDELKKQNVWIYGAVMSAERNYDAIDSNDALAIVIGSEGRGIRKLVAEHCDFLVKIPMYGKLNSLNASVAAGILFFEIIKQRTNKKTSKTG